jgi:hypothetical protein
MINGEEMERIILRAIWEYILHPTTNPKLMAGVMIEYEQKMEKENERKTT